MRFKHTITNYFENKITSTEQGKYVQYKTSDIFILLLLIRALIKKVRLVPRFEMRVGTKPSEKFSVMEITTGEIGREIRTEFALII